MNAQLEFKRCRGWGGRRRGAGRPNSSGKLNHMKRPRVSVKTPLHITFKLNQKLPTLRRRAQFRIFRAAAMRARVFGFKLLQYSVQSNHGRLLVEAADDRALASGMRAINISLAKSINAHAGRSGAALKERFHLQVITNPTQMKNALAYVLLNH